MSFPSSDRPPEMDASSPDIIIRIDRRAAKLMAYAATAGLLALVGQAMPAIADVVNSFSAGEKISAAAVNDNFADLDERVEVFEGALTVGSSGNIGVGISDPQRPLHVAGTGWFIDPAGGDAGLVVGEEAIEGGGMNLKWNAVDDRLHVYPFGRQHKEGMTLTSDVKLGVGSDDPRAGLHVEGGDPKLLLVKPIDSTGKAWAGVGGGREGDDGYQSFLAFYTTNDGNATDDTSAERVRVTAHGDVGIGETNPGARLHVHQTEGDQIDMLFDGTESAVGVGTYSQAWATTSGTTSRPFPRLNGREGWSAWMFWEDGSDGSIRCYAQFVAFDSGVNNGGIKIISSSHDLGGDCQIGTSNNSAVGDGLDIFFNGEDFYIKKNTDMSVGSRLWIHATGPGLAD